MKTSSLITLFRSFALLKYKAGRPPIVICSLLNNSNKNRAHFRLNTENSNCQIFWNTDLIIDFHTL